MDDENQKPKLEPGSLGGLGADPGADARKKTVTDFQRNQAAEKQAAEKRRIKEAAELEASVEAWRRIALALQALLRQNKPVIRKRDRLFHAARAVAGTILLPRARWAEDKEQRQIRTVIGGALGLLLGLPTRPRIQVSPCTDECSGSAVSLYWLDDAGKGVEVSFHIAQVQADIVPEESEEAQVIAFKAPATGRTDADPLGDLLRELGFRAATDGPLDAGPAGPAAP